MSGIYIPDVGLPQDGDFELWISVKKDGSYNYNISGGWNEGKQKAVPVPKHGRLIDGDKLAEEQKENVRAYHANLITLDDLAECLLKQSISEDAAPTIIPAEEGET